MYWLELCNGDYNPGKEPNELRQANYSNKFYLSIKDNCAMIQAGHSNNATTHNEKNDNSQPYFLFIQF